MWFFVLPSWKICCVYIIEMETFYAKGKHKLTILGTDLGVSHVIEKCLCATFEFQPWTMHISKDNAFDDDNNVTRFIYQVSFPCR
jgi:hypothetical protein